MTQTDQRPLYREDAYLEQDEATVIAHTEEGGLILDRTIFYPQGGGQPGDSGSLTWGDRRLSIATTIKATDGASICVPAEAQPLPPIGTAVTQTLDWDRRYLHMRIHTALHLLSVVIPLPVTGGQITSEKGRLDFDMPDAPENKEELQAQLQALIDQDLVVSESWITDAELDANPGLVKTMSVQPPRGAGQVRLVRIGTAETQVDLQPCGGTHVARSAEIGQIRLGKIEKKGRRNRRVSLHLES